MSFNEVEILIEICRQGAVLPTYANPGDAGMDVYAAEEVLIRPGETAVIPTGFKVAIPDGYEIQVRPRSGISLKTPLRISNSPGTIDCGFRDEVGIIMSNSSSGTYEENILTIDNKHNIQGIYKIRKGDRVAQIVLQVVPRIKFKLTNSVNEAGVNRGGGFGSTGTR